MGRRMEVLDAARPCPVRDEPVRYALPLGAHGPERRSIATVTWKAATNMTRTINCEFDWMAGHLAEYAYVPLLLKHNKTRTEFWYAAACCGRRATANNMCLKENDWRLIWALEHWPELMAVASEQGLVNFAMSEQGA